MPRQTAAHARGARAQDVALATEPAWYLLPMQLLLERPRDAFALAAAACAVIAIIVNALFLQTARHPSPLFKGTVVRLNETSDQFMAPVKSKPLKAPAPQPAGPPPAAPLTAPRVPAAVAAPPTAAPRRADPLADLIAADRRVVAVQRALSEFGYGQIDADGVMGPATRAAIERFEREQKMPVTGQIGDRLVRELSALTGRPIE